MLSSVTKSAVAAKLKSRRGLRRGLTLIEAAMVLVILALVVGAVMLYYSSASTSRRVSQVVGQIGSVQQAVRAVFAGQADYTGLTATILQNQLPTSMYTGGQMFHAFQSTMTVAPRAVNGANGFQITLLNMPQEACAKLAVTDFGRATLEVDVNGSPLPPPVTAVTANGACVAGSTNTMAWTFQ